MTWIFTASCWLRRACLIIAPLVLLLTGGPGLVNATPAAERQAKAQELQRLREQIRSLHAALDADQAQRKDLRAELHTAEQGIAKMSRIIAELEQQAGAHAAELQRLVQREETLRTELSQERTALVAQVRSAFIAGRQEQIKLLLNQQDPIAAGRTLVYYEYLNRARTERIATVTGRLHELEQVRADILQRQEELDGLRAQHLQQRQALEEFRQVRTALLERVNSEIRDRQVELKRLLEDETRLRQVLRELDRPRPATPPSAPAPADPKGPFAGLKGTLSWPVSGALLATYGATRSVGDLRWRGVLIGAPEGQAVRAIARGQVVFADWLRGFGQLLIIDHGGGYMSLYGHNKSLQKRVSEWVEPGEVIAVVGSNDGQAEPGLYFEIRHNGEPVDPGLWCRSSPAGGSRG